MNKTFFKVGRAVVAFMFVLSMSMPAFADHGVELAAAGITPQSSFLYFFDRLMENIRQLVTRNPNSKAELKIRYASERLAEVKALIDAGQSKDLISQALDEFFEEIGEINELIDTEKAEGADISSIASSLND